MQKEENIQMTELKALLRDMELYKASKKPLPILDRDIELLKLILEKSDEKN